MWTTDTSLPKEQQLYKTSQAQGWLPNIYKEENMDWSWFMCSLDVIWLQRWTEESIHGL